MSSIAIIDFETTGISPNMGDRATEVAIVMLEGGQVVDRFQSLMNAGVRVNSFITQLTGITNGPHDASHRLIGCSQMAAGLRPVVGPCAEGLRGHRLSCAASACQWGCLRGSHPARATRHATGRPEQTAWPSWPRCA